MKKNYKIRFALSNAFGPSCEQVVLLQNKSKAAFVGLTGLTLVQSSALYALIVMGAAMAVDSLLSCLEFEEIK